MSKQSKYFGFFLLALLIVGIFVFMTHTSNTLSSKSSTVPKKTQTGQFNKSQYSTSDLSSIWVIVNKQHPLNPKTYVPSDLITPSMVVRSKITSDESKVSSKIAPSLERMVTDARSQGILLNLQSGYRSYQLQISVYNNEVSSFGQSTADKESARPGYSEHQTGLAVDLGSIPTPSCDVAQCFGTTKEGVWLAANSYKYGFIVRYTSDNQSVTGYEVEPWHLRYVGVALSTELHDKNVTSLEQFFNVSGGTSYK